MSILIKGIEMPKEPWECPCHNGETGDCNVTQKVCFEIPKDCPLVEVPTPHGDLIDKEEHKRFLENKIGRCLELQDHIAWLNEQPTIIEGEE